MRNNSRKGCPSPGDWQLEARLIDLHIRQRQAAIREHHTLKGYTAQQVTTAIDNAVNAHANGAEQSDDITIMAIKRT